MYRCIVFQNVALDFIETFCIHSCTLKGVGCEVGNQPIEGNRGCGTLQSTVCSTPAFEQSNVCIVDFCCSGRVKVDRYMIQVKSDLTEV